MAVYGYGRVSSFLQASEGVSLEVQQRQIEGWCTMQGLSLARVFIEEGVSGSVPLADRPQGSQLWAALQKGDTVIASRLDRMFRSAVDALQTVERLKAMQVSLVLIDVGGDVSNGLSRLFLTIVAAFAEAEVDRIRERIATVKQDQKSRGRYLGGRVPFGYRAGEDGALVENPAEQVMLAYAVEQHQQAHASIRAIHADITKQGGRISVSGLHKVLQQQKKKRG